MYIINSLQIKRFLLFMMDDNFFYAHRRKNIIHSAVVDKEQKITKDSKFTANYYTQSL